MICRIAVKRNIGSRIAVAYITPVLDRITRRGVIERFLKYLAAFGSTPLSMEKNDNTEEEERIRREEEERVRKEQNERLRKRLEEWNQRREAEERQRREAEEYLRREVGQEGRLDRKQDSAIISKTHTDKWISEPYEDYVEWLENHDMVKQVNANIEGMERKDKVEQFEAIREQKEKERQRKEEERSKPNQGWEERRQRWLEEMPQRKVEMQQRWQEEERLRQEAEERQKKEIERNGEIRCACCYLRIGDTPETYNDSIKGKTYYFCNPKCKAKYLKLHYEHHYGVENTGEIIFQLFKLLLIIIFLFTITGGCNALFSCL